MSEKDLHENWVPDVAQREAVEAPDQEWVPEHADDAGAPDQEWLPEHAAVEGFERDGERHYRCLFCSGRVDATRQATDAHRAEHAS